MSDTAGNLNANDVKMLSGLADAAGLLYDKLRDQTDSRTHRPAFTHDQVFEIVKAAMTGAVTEAL